MRRRLAAALAGAAALCGLAVGHASSLTLTSGRLTSFQTCVLTATPNPTATVADAYVDQAMPTVNQSTLTMLSIEPGGTLSTGRRAYVRFDLTGCSPAIPASATIRLATLRLNVNTLPVALCETEDVFAVTSAWTETGITWANQPAGTTLDVPVSAGRTSAANVGGAPCTNSVTAAYVPWDVTPDVSRWVAGTATNNGWMIRNDGEVAGSAADLVNFIAEQSGMPAQAPQLIVTYVT